MLEQKIIGLIKNEGKKYIGRRVDECLLRDKNLDIDFLLNYISTKDLLNTDMRSNTRIVLLHFAKQGLLTNELLEKYFELCTHISVIDLLYRYCENISMELLEKIVEKGIKEKTIFLLKLNRIENLSEEFIDKYNEIIDFACLSENKNVSEKFLVNIKIIKICFGLVFQKETFLKNLY